MCKAITKCLPLKVVLGNKTSINLPKESVLDGRNIVGVIIYPNGGHFKTPEGESGLSSDAIQRGRLEVIENNVSLATVPLQTLTNTNCCPFVPFEQNCVKDTSKWQLHFATDLFSSGAASSGDVLEIFCFYE